MCGSATSHWVGDGGTHASLPHFLRAPSLRVGLRVVPAAGGLCPLARRKRAGSDLLCYRLRGLRPPTTFMLTAAGLRRQSALQRRGVVNRCWCDGGGGYPPSSGGGVYGESTPSGDCPALCGGFRSGHLSEGNLGICMVKSAAFWLAPVFTARKGDVCLEEAADCGSQSPARRRPRGLGYVIMGNA